MEYNFLAKYNDISLARIVEENKSADFLRICWKKENGEMSILYLSTPKGTARVKAAGLGDLWRYDKDANISHTGKLMSCTFGPPGRIGVLFSSCVFHGDAEFKAFYTRLREREERKHKITVTAFD